MIEFIGNNQCQSEGFFRDPKDCVKFYRCTRDEGADFFRVYEFACGPGTVFDETISTCNHPNQAPPCQNNEIPGQQQQSAPQQPQPSFPDQYTQPQQQPPIESQPQQPPYNAGDTLPMYETPTSVLAPQPYQPELPSQPSYPSQSYPPNYPSYQQQPPGPQQPAPSFFQPSGHVDDEWPTDPGSYTQEDPLYEPDPKDYLPADESSGAESPSLPEDENQEVPLAGSGAPPSKPQKPPKKPKQKKPKKPKKPQTSPLEEMDPESEQVEPKNTNDKPLNDDEAQQLTNLDEDEIEPEEEDCNCKPVQSVFQCKEEGKFADKKSCKNFYRCTTSGDGFKADQFECDMGMAFDEEQFKCVPESESKCKQS